MMESRGWWESRGWLGVWWMVGSLRIVRARDSWGLWVKDLSMVGDLESGEGT